MTTVKRNPTIILIAGHWLGAWAWDDVLEHLEPDHSRAIAITLPGLDRDDPARSTRTLDDQAAAIRDILARLDVSEDQPATLVAHSGANAPVSVVLDRHPELREAYFGNYTRVLLLSQSDDPAVVDAGRAAAEMLGLRFEHVHVGLQQFHEAVGLSIRKVA